MTKLNDVSPGEWSLAHAKWMDENSEQTLEGMSLDNEMARQLVDNAAVEDYVGRISDDPSALDVQVGGDHYKDFEIQPIEFITSNSLGFCEGNVIKYVCRHASKGGGTDLDKAIHYLELLKEVCYESN